MDNPQRQAEQRERLRQLERSLTLGRVGIKVTARGGIEFTNWAAAERGDLCDACTFRQLTASGSAELRKALARAEVTAGRSVDMAVIGRG